MREKVKLLSSAGTGHFYVAMKNKRLHPEKMEVRKFDRWSASTWPTRKPRSSNCLGLASRVWPPSLTIDREPAVWRALHL